MQKRGRQTHQQFGSRVKTQHTAERQRERESEREREKERERERESEGAERRPNINNYTRDPWLYSRGGNLSDSKSLFPENVLTVKSHSYSLLSFSCELVRI